MTPRAYSPHRFRTWLHNRRYTGNHATRPYSRNFCTAYGDVYPRNVQFAPFRSLNRLFISGYLKGSYYDKPGRMFG